MTQPALAHTTKDGRVYRIAGELYPSITTCIQGGVPKPGLINWAAKMAALYVVENFDEVAADRAAKKPKAERVEKIKDAHKRYKEAKGKRGDEVHAWCEWYARQSMGLTTRTCWECKGEAKVVNDDGEVLPCPTCIEPHVPESAQAALRGAKKFMEDWKPEFVHVERTVVNRKRGYAGTFDFICYLNIAGIGRVLVLGDYKTSNGVWPETGLQLAAVRYAEAMLVLQPDGTYEELAVPTVDMCVEVHIQDDDYDVYPVAAGPEQFVAFRAAIAVRHFEVVTSKRTIGVPVHPGS